MPISFGTFRNRKVQESMEFVEITENQKEEFNRLVTHPLQSFEWGQFRKKTGVKVIRRGLFKNGELIDGFTLTIHKIPRTKFTIGYLPKGNTPTPEVLEELKKIGKENSCIFIQLEPNVLSSHQSSIINHQSLKPSFHPLFTKYTFVLDLTKSEDELLKSFHSKTRYNIKVAQKHSVKVEIDDSDKAFKEYLKLTDETTNRQKFFAHTPSYHTKMWETLRQAQGKPISNNLSSHLLTATYIPSDHEQITNNQSPITLASWILFVFHDYLYYPYGASSNKFRNTMASNLIMWEAIKFGKKMNLRYFDMWGALDENPNPKDPWYGFHKFKEGYGATHTEFVGSYDLIIKPQMYEVYKVLDKLRWAYLRIRKTFT